MKKLIAIAFIVIHLFNIGGALAVHQLLVFKSDNFYKAQISKNLYNIHELTEVKIPAAMPNVSSWGAYVRVAGRVDFQDASYNYVKMKITRDGIYLLCVPNYSTTRLSTHNVIRAKQIKDFPVQQKEHVPFGKSKTLDNFKFSFVQFAFNATIKTVKSNITQPVHGVFSQSMDIPELPPKSSSGCLS